jgi:hypothetical protein
MPIIFPSFARRTTDDSKSAAALRACLAETDSLATERALGHLVETHVEPVMRRVIIARLRRHGNEHLSHLEDVLSEAVIAFLLHFEDLRQQRAEPVEKIDAFAAMLASRAVNDYFRRTNPAFHALRNRLLYLLERYPALARWKYLATGEWLSGLAVWKNKKLTPLRSIEEVDARAWLNRDSEKLHAAEQLMQIFKGAGLPIRFNDLALLMARVWHVQDSRTENVEDHEFVDQSHSVDQRLSHKQWLAVLWMHICELSRNQRAALLLNLKGADGSCGASLLVSTGLVSLRELAKAIEIPDEEFAGIWQRLPLNDLEVGHLLGLERQQVINLRKCARGRLERAMGSAGFGE